MPFWGKTAKPANTVETNANKEARGLVKFNRVKTVFSGYGNSWEEKNSVWGTPEEAAAEAAKGKGDKLTAYKGTIISYTDKKQALNKAKAALEATISDAGIEQLKATTNKKIQELANQISGVDEDISGIETKIKELEQSGGRRNKNKTKKNKRS
jgi:hypothetical protein